MTRHHLHPMTLEIQTADVLAFEGGQGRGSAWDRHDGSAWDRHDTSQLAVAA